MDKNLDASLSLSGLPTRDSCAAKFPIPSSLVQYREFKAFSVQGGQQQEANQICFFALGHVCFWILHGFTITKTTVHGIPRLMESSGIPQTTSPRERNLLNIMAYLSLPLRTTRAIIDKSQTIQPLAMF